MRHIFALSAVVIQLGVCATVVAQGDRIKQTGLNWSVLPPIPDELGVAGPVVGVLETGSTQASMKKHLVVAGGANFPRPVWESSKVWHGDAYAAVVTDSAHGIELGSWSNVGALPRPLGYSACVSTPQGLVVVGGNDAAGVYAECFLLNLKDGKLESKTLPDFPSPIVYAQASLLGSRVIVSGGQTSGELSTASRGVWQLNIAAPEDGWEQLPDLPGPQRAFHLSVVQNDGYSDVLYVMGGRYEKDGEVMFLEDCWSFDLESIEWKKRASLPTALSAGSGQAFGQSHIVVLSGDDGKLFGRADELKDDHPGFLKKTWLYHTITNTWIDAGPSPCNQVTTPAVRIGNHVLIASGEVRPRVRTPNVWQIGPKNQQGQFGPVDYIVLVAYLLALVWIGVYFARRTQNTNDYFRASGEIPWWAAGCSIFATMLSSLTFLGIPSKAFAQDWVYAVGNFMIPLTAIVAVRLALPFYRRIDATSAYEYLELRFHSSLRYFASLVFSTFHVFRMAIVMSLTGLALAVATPLEAWQAVVVMGVLSIIYCGLGGISAVIWTDTLQTVVLLGGAILALAWMLIGSGTEADQIASSVGSGDKLRLANWHWSPFEAQVALWVVALGGLGQNISSYTADQAVVQRYMTTESASLAGRAIWTNALLSIPATLLFFGMGTALFVFYQAHPERLDPAISTDQIFPLFISRELATGVSGLIVAAIFAAAQSTVSTSMNSVATTIVTDCVQPFATFGEKSLLRIAQILTVAMGILGTVTALFFIDPDLRSLFDEFIKVVGLFMGILGGLFLLGVLFPRANAIGAWIGALCGSGAMISAWQMTEVHGYLYPVIGIATCVVSGLCASRIGKPPTSVERLTLRRSASDNS